MPRRPGEIRIIAGSHKGHRLKVAAGDVVRPTKDRVREAVFSTLGDLTNTRVLDLFAGSGALGLEALSRGSAHATFVEQDRTVAGILKRNITSLGLDARAEVLETPYDSALRRLLQRGGVFDLLFLDPPYTMLAQVDEAVATVLPQLLGPGGLVIVEGPRRAQARLGLPVVFQRRYGNTLISIYGEEQH
ncbi:MAG TPA: 16S rRNA (guanine(966)-N(2))-methyltransferase RsmD [Thermoleophilia bacterium]|nr:16S rRNA (guanine(966)-N(2))-methyltransferase RsmD [Thermoleophilia bacterium]